MRSDLRDQLQSALGTTYTLERELGHAGMSHVFVAGEPALGRRVVLKAFAPEMAHEFSADRFAREINLLARLQHPNIIPVLTAGVAAGLPYYTMPYVDGESLRARLARGSPDDRLRIGAAINVLNDVARALAYAHAQGVIHRDIKPGNVLLSGDAAFVADFGIAKAIEAARNVRQQPVSETASMALTAAGTSVGTPEYMAPEQAVADPEVDHRADLYSWGVLAYEMLTGAHPFGEKASAHAFVKAHLLEQPAPIDVGRLEIPAAVALVIMNCLAKDPAERPPAARQIVEALSTSRLEQRRTISVAMKADDTELKTPSDKSICVLPFVNVNGDAESEYFSDGITDDIINALAHLPGVRVSGRTSSFAFKGKATEIVEVASKLKVATVLEGTVRRSGNQLRISAQLISATNGFQLWSGRFDRELADVFRIQDEVSRAIAAELSVKLSERSAPTPRPRTTNLLAYDLYLRGRYFWGRRGPHFRTAIDYFNRAASADEHFAAPHAGLADCHVLMAAYGMVSSRDVAEPARQAAYRALELDDSSEESHYAVGLYETQLGWNVDRAESALRRAIEINPSWAFPHVHLSHLMVSIGEFDGVVTLAERACELDPLSGLMHGLAAAGLIAVRAHDRARQVAERGVELDDESPMAHASLGLSRALDQRFTEAIESVQRGVELSKRSPLLLSYLGVTLARADRRAEATEVVSELTVRSCVDHFAAMVLWQLGEEERALASFERAVSLRAANFYVTPMGLGLRSLVRDPRWHALLSRSGLRSVADIHASFAP